MLFGAQGEHDGAPSRIAARMRSATRMLNRRTVIVVLVFGTFLGALIVASSRLGELCADATYCPNLSDIHNALPWKPKPTPEATPHAPVSDAPDDDNDDDDYPEYNPGDGLQDGSKHGVEDGSEDGPGDDGPEDAPENTPAAPSDEEEVFRKVDPACADFPDTSKILLVMKTGASEAYSKVPTQVLTNLRCVFDFLIFSDMAQEIAGYQVRDSLDTVLDEVKTGNQDFDLYRNQQHCLVDQESCNKNKDVASQGWALDKYKNIHIAEKTLKLRPNHDWYLFVDADTYVIWSTLVEWLLRIDSSKPHYLGSVAMLGDFPFGHGGSGYLVSRTAMKDFFDGRTDVANNWDAEASETCCGDYMFAYALKNDTDIAVNNMWPTINGEKPYTMSYGPYQWCHPIVTMHHIGSEEVSEFDAFEQERNYTSPMRIKDLYHRFVADKLAPHQDEWDNMSDDVIYLDASEGHDHEDWQVDRSRQGDDLSDVEQKAHLSFDDCRRVCLVDEYCFQYKFANEVCTLAHSISHGHPREGTKSGWDVGKIKAWAEAHDDCGEIEWPTA